MEYKHSGFASISSNDDGYIDHNTKNSSDDSAGSQGRNSGEKSPKRKLILINVVCLLFDFSFVPFRSLGLPLLAF